MFWTRLEDRTTPFDYIKCSTIAADATLPLAIARRMPIKLPPLALDQLSPDECLSTDWSYFTPRIDRVLVAREGQVLYMGLPGHYS
jgi:hypothetical protein